MFICIILNIFLTFAYVEIEDVELVTSTNKSVIIYKAENHGTLVQYEMEILRKLNQFIVSRLSTNSFVHIRFNLI